MKFTKVDIKARPIVGKISSVPNYTMAMTLLSSLRLRLPVHGCRESLQLVLLGLGLLLATSHHQVTSQQISRPIIVSSASPQQQQQQQPTSQYYGGNPVVVNSAQKSGPAPAPQPPSRQQLQQQYQQQQQQLRHQQQQQQQQISYQKQQAQPPPKSVSRGPPQPQQQLNSNEASYEDEEDYKDEPDRLTQLLLNSKFQCSAKKDGYYADESLACEVFHYCHDNVKHSWMCPNQFVFHQVHLICVPPSTENICKQSSSFHFVNEYLYRPVNAKEASNNHNVSLRYGDRYYPEGYTPGAPFDEQYLISEQSQHQHRATAAPTAGNKGKQQVYFSADSVNIPLSQRRPVPPTPQTQAHQRHQASSSAADDDYDYE